MRVWLSLWPAILVWLAYVLPVMTWNADMLRSNDLLDIGRTGRAMLWVLTHTWPYSRLYRAHAAWQRAFPEPPRCPVCRTRDVSPRHLMLHFPDELSAWTDAEQAYEDRYWTPPSDPAEAVRWLEERTEVE